MVTAKKFIDIFARLNYINNNMYSIEHNISKILDHQDQLKIESFIGIFYLLIIDFFTFKVRAIFLIQILLTMYIIPKTVYSLA